MSLNSFQAWIDSFKTEDMYKEFYIKILIGFNYWCQLHLFLSFNAFERKAKHTRNMICVQHQSSWKNNTKLSSYSLQLKQACLKYLLFKTINFKLWMFISYKYCFQTPSCLAPLVDLTWLFLFKHPQECWSNWGFGHFLWPVFVSQLTKSTRELFF